MNHRDNIMTDFVKIIESDDLDTFKKHFKLENWKESITKIANYSGSRNINSEITYDDADCFKYALHCNADKIFNYLLPLVDTDKHGENYGWPLLAMALQNERYDYAHQIINHHRFNPYPRYHTNTFMYLEKRPKVQEHIEFLFDYLKKFDKWTLSDEHMAYTFSHLVCHSEETFNRFDTFYKTQMNDPNASILDIYKNKLNVLGEEIFCRRYNKFMIEKLSTDDISKLLKTVKDESVFFMNLFKNDNAKEGLTYLLKSPKLLSEYFEDKAVLFSYLSLDCILLLDQHGIDVWREEKNKSNGLDYVLDNKNIQDEATWYFINKYPKEILERLQSQGRKSNIQIYCEQKLLEEELPKKDKKRSYPKI